MISINKRRTKTVFLSTDAWKGPCHLRLVDLRNLFETFNHTTHRSLVFWMFQVSSGHDDIWENVKKLLRLFLCVWMRCVRAWKEFMSEKYSRLMKSESVIGVMLFAMISYPFPHFQTPMMIKYLSLLPAQSSVNDSGDWMGEVKWWKLAFCCSRCSFHLMQLIICHISSEAFEIPQPQLTITCLNWHQIFWIDFCWLSQSRRLSKQNQRHSLPKIYTVSEEWRNKQKRRR